MVAIVSYHTRTTINMYGLLTECIRYDMRCVSDALLVRIPQPDL
jgi:hypothetical protein